jgi:hypothetical protein
MAAKSSKKIINNLLALQGVSAVAVIGRDGFVIESESKSDVDLDALGAVVSTGYGSSEVMATEMNLGKIAQTMIECEEGKILIADCGESSILSVITNSSAIIGNIRHNISKVIDDLAAII